MSVYLAIEVLGIPIRETDTTAQNIGIVGIFPEGGKVDLTSARRGTFLR
jgi:hypothetical protein